MVSSACAINPLCAIHLGDALTSVLTHMNHANGMGPRAAAQDNAWVLKNGMILPASFHAQPMLTVPLPAASTHLSMSFSVPPVSITVRNAVDTVEEGEEGRSEMSMPTERGMAQTLDAAVGAMQSAAYQIAAYQRKVKRLNDENARLREMAEYIKRTWTCTSCFAPGCEHMCKCPLCLVTRALDKQTAD